MTGPDAQSLIRALEAQGLDSSALEARPESAPVGQVLVAPADAARTAVHWLRARLVHSVVLVPQPVTDAGIEPIPRDDVDITRPEPSIEELTTRIEMARLRAAREVSALELVDGRVDLRGAFVERGGERIALTAVEVGLIGYLAGRAGEVVSSDRLLRHVLGYRAGVRSRALHYAILRLRRKIEADPSQPEHIQTVRGEGFRWGYPGPPRSAPAGPSTELPMLGLLGPGRALLGRAAELRALVDRLASQRLVVLAGPPGVGKTRLAVEGALALADGAGGQVVFVGREDAASPAGVGAAIVRGLGGRLPTTEPDALRVARALLASSPPVCVVLDDVGFEHPSMFAALEDLCASSSRVSLVATSHRRLPAHVRSRSRMNLRPLEPEAAREMFWHCVRRVRPDAEDEPGAESCVERLVELVDRLPLGIEVVAARARLMSLSGLAALLERSLHHLETKDARIEQRHHSLLHVVWSLIRSVSPAARLVCAHATVTVGGFDLAAAEAICRPRSGTVREALAELVANHLVLVDDRGPELRYEVLGLVRRGIVEGPAGEQLQAARVRHVHHFASWAERWQKVAVETGDPLATGRLSDDIGNLERAFRHGLQLQSHLVVPLVRALSVARSSRMQWRRYYDLVVELEHRWSTLPGRCRLVLLHGRTLGRVMTGDLATPGTLAECEALARRHGDVEIALRCRIWRGYCGEVLSPDEVLQCRREARLAGLHGIEAELLWSTHRVSSERARHDDLVWLRGIRDITDADRTVATRAWGRLIWAETLLHTLAPGEAVREIEACLRMAPAWLTNMAMAPVLLAVADVELGRLDAASERLDRYASATGNPHGSAEVIGHWLRATIQHVRGDVAGAAARYERLMAMSAPFQEPHCPPMLYLLAALAAGELGEVDRAQRLFERAVAVARDDDADVGRILQMGWRFLHAAERPPTGGLAGWFGRALGRRPGVGDVMLDFHLRVAVRVMESRWPRARRGE